MIVGGFYRNCIPEDVPFRAVKPLAVACSNAWSDEWTRELRLERIVSRATEAQQLRLLLPRGDAPSFVAGWIWGS